MNVSTLSPARGFTLIEMMVVLAIILIITSIALLGQSSFNRSLVLTDTAYTIAFSVREAQSLGISSRKAGTIQNAGYGVHFSANASNYLLFADTNPVAPGDTANPDVCSGHTETSGPEAKPGNCMYDAVSEIVRTYTLNNGFKIKSFCGTPAGGGAERCSTSSSGALQALDILYMRPNTNSVIIGITNSSFPAPTSARVKLTDATIRITSPDGVAERCIYVSQAGQVSVQQPGGPQCP